MKTQCNTNKLIITIKYYYITKVDYYNRYNITA
jgi:hypothetical protein